MTDPRADALQRIARALALGACVLGLGVIGALVALGASNGLDAPWDALGLVQDAATFGGPYLLALLVTFLAPRTAPAVWIVCGVFAALLPTVLLLSPATMITVPAAVVLIVAGGLGIAGVGGRGVVVGGLVALVAAVAALGAVWFAGEPGCWYETADGWVKRPFSNVIVGTGVCSQSAPTIASTFIPVAIWPLAALALRWWDRPRRLAPSVPSEAVAR